MKSKGNKLLPQFSNDTQRKLHQTLPLKHTSVFIFAIVGTTVLLQNFTFSFTEFSGSKNRFYRNDANFVKVETTTASLARVTNAIALLKDVNEKSTIMKKVLGEVLNFHDVSLFDTINTTDAEDIAQALKSYSKIADQKTTRIQEMENVLKTLALPENITNSLPQKQSTNDTILLPSIENSISSFASFIHILSSFNISKINLNNPKKNIQTVTDSIKSFQETLQLPVNDSFFFQLEDLTEEFDELNKKLILITDGVDIMLLEKYLKTLNLYAREIEQYEKLTDQEFLTRVEKNFNSLKVTTKNIFDFRNTTNNNHIKEKTCNLHELINTTVMVSERKYLIAFSQGSKYFKKLMKDFDNANLKQLLNRGKSLSELKNLLEPVLEVDIQVNAAKHVWTNKVRKTHSKIISRLSTVLNMNWKFESNSILVSLTKMNNLLQELKSFKKFNHSMINEFEQILNLFQILISSNKNIEKLVKVCKMVITKINNFKKKIEKLNLPLNSNESILIFNSLLSDSCFSLMNEKFQLFEEHTKKIESLSANATGFKNVFTETIFNDIFQAVNISRLFEVYIKQINYEFLLLNFLTPFQVGEKAEIEQLFPLFLSAKTVIDKCEKLEENLYSKLKNIEGFPKLTTFNNASKTTIQLVHFQNILQFNQTQHLRKIIEGFLKNSEVLSRKIKSLPFGEYYSLYDVNYFFEFTELMTNLSSKVKTLSSTLPNEKLSFKWFGNVLCRFNNISILGIDLSHMFSIVRDLKKTSIAQSQEVNNVETFLLKMKKMQFEAKLEINTLHHLLPEAQQFFNYFFAKYLPDEKHSLFWPIVVTAFFMVLSCVFAYIIHWLRTTIEEIRKTDGYNSTFFG